MQPRPPLDDEADSCESGLGDRAPDRGVRLGLAGPLIVAWLAHRAVVLAVEARPPEAGESLLLRWLRAFPEHPVRVPLALALLAFALRATRARAS